MKESEVDAKVHVVLRRNAINLDWKPLSIANAAKVGREVAVAIARELGVPVEPDEPTLPDKLNITVHKSHDSHGPAYTVAESLAEDSTSITVSGITFDFCRNLADKLVAAYNSLCWRTGCPSHNGHYLVHIGDDAHTAYWHNDHWSFDINDNNPLQRLSIHEWMPIPLVGASRG